MSKRIAALRSRHPASWTVAGLLVGVMLVVAVTGVIFGLREVAPVLSLGVLYLLAIVTAAVFFGLWVALSVSVASMLAFNFFFLAPVHTLRLRETENWVALAVYLAVAIVVSELAVRARRRAEDAEQRGREAAFTAEVSAMLLEPGFVQDKLNEIGARAGAVLSVAQARIELDSLRRPQPDELAHPLVVGERRIGQLVLDRSAAPDAAVLARVLPSLASLLASAVDRERLALKALEAESLRRSDAVKTTILRTLGHDLRSPLTAISASSEVLDQDAGDLSAGERAELVGSIRQEAARLGRLVSNLLDLSRLEAGAANPRPELWTVDGLVARALGAVGPASSRVRLVLPHDLPPLRVDPGQIERALVNLLENALESSSASDPVEVTSELADGEVVIRVADHGPGLDGRDIERIFEPFERGTGETKQGTGLGLAIAKGFVEANGGRLWAETLTGRGAVLAVALPLADVPARVEA
jgi:two-component system, OmpR family, sensor histidine kinase KdpD